MNEEINMENTDRANSHDQYKNDKNRENTDGENIHYLKSDKIDIKNFNMSLL